MAVIGGSVVGGIVFLLVIAAIVIVVVLLLVSKSRKSSRYVQCMYVFVCNYTSIVTYMYMHTCMDANKQTSKKTDYLTNQLTN